MLRRSLVNVRVCPGRSGRMSAGFGAKAQFDRRPPLFAGFQAVPPLHISPFVPWPAPRGRRRGGRAAKAARPSRRRPARNASRDAPGAGRGGAGTGRGGVGLGGAAGRGGARGRGTGNGAGGRAGGRQSEGNGVRGAAVCRSLMYSPQPSCPAFYAPYHWRMFRGGRRRFSRVYASAISTGHWGCSPSR